MHQFAIVGAGPAGLQLGYYLQRAGADYVALERDGAPGSFFREYPRHRRLISLNKVHTHSADPEIRLRWDWNSLLSDAPRLMFPQYSTEYYPHADDLLRYLADFQKTHGLNVNYGTEVLRIERMDDRFVITTDGGPIEAECVIVATGWGAPFVPNIKGIELALGYEDMTADPSAFTGQRVLIVGKGNSAFETAHAILPHASMVHLASRRALKLAWNTKHPGDVRGQYGSILDSYQFKTLHSVLDCTIDEIRKVGNRFEADISYTHADGETATLQYESVIRCTGFRMDTTVFGPSCQPSLTREGRLPAVLPDWQSTNVDGLYFAGTIAQERDFKRASSAFIDGFRYNLRTLTRLLMERYEGRALPFGTVTADARTLTDLTLGRVNWSSALWTQFEFLCDAIVVDRATGRARHYEDLPEEYAVQRFWDEPHYYTFNLRWGRDEYADVFNIERHPEPGRAAESAFIHPVIRRYSGTRMVEELHLLEDLLAEWRRPDRHIVPLHAFFERDLASN